MKVQHTSSHWVLVVLTLAALLFCLRDAHGQSGSAAVFEGRPALAGANGGLGAQAGMPQGGIGVQGNEAALRKDVTPAKDRGVVKEERSTRKVAKSAKKTLRQARHGTMQIDATAER